MHFDLELTATSGTDRSTRRAAGCRGLLRKRQPRLQRGCRAHRDHEALVRHRAELQAVHRPGAERRAAHLVASRPAVRATQQDGVPASPTADGDAPTTTRPFPRTRANTRSSHWAMPTSRRMPSMVRWPSAADSIDGTNNQDGTVCSNPGIHGRACSHSIVGEIFRRTVGNFQGPGYTLDALPFVWTDFEALALSLKQGSHAGGYQVYTVNQGG